MTTGSVIPWYTVKITQACAVAKTSPSKKHTRDCCIVTNCDSYAILLFVL